MQPTKYNAKTANAVVAAIAAGHSVRSAAGSASVSDESVRRWIAAHPAFAARVEEARSAYLEACIKAVTSNVKDDPRLALAVLERKDPDEWAPRKKHEVTGQDGGPIKIVWTWPTEPPPAE